MVLGLADAFFIFVTARRQDRPFRSLRKPVYLHIGYSQFIRITDIVMATLASSRLITAPQLGQLLKSARKQHKLTQADVAGRLALSQNRVSHLEQHPDQLSFKQLLAWCAVVGLELHLAERSQGDASEGEW